MGPVTYAKHLISGPRLPFTAAYFGSIALTLVFAIKVRLLLSHPSIMLLVKSACDGTSHSNDLITASWSLAC